MAYVSFATEAERKRFAHELRGLPGYDPLRPVGLIRLSAYPQTVLFEARLIAEATERLRAESERPVSKADSEVESTDL
jgi:hypothetical protein